MVGGRTAQILYPHKLATYLREPPPTAQELYAHGIWIQ